MSGFSRYIEIIFEVGFGNTKSLSFDIIDASSSFVKPS